MRNINGWLFNRERIFLAAMQDLSNLMMAYETSPEGLTDLESSLRIVQFGNNEIRLPGWRLNGRMRQVDHRLVKENLRGMYGRDIAVLRKGVSPYIEISATCLVPGDVVFMISGDVVPADIRILECESLSVDQHFFDGCRIPVPKMESAFEEIDFAVSSVIYLPDVVFAGTKVVQGKLKGMVISTGPATYLGKCLLDY